MTIEQILQMPIGEKLGGFDVFIKTYKKNWQSGKDWYQQVIIMDATGEMPADIKVGSKYNPIRGRAQKLRVIVGIIQEAEYLGKDRKKLYIDQWKIHTITTTEYEAEMGSVENDWDKVNRGKVRCWLVAAYIQSGKTIGKMDKDTINFLVDFVMDGK